MSSYARLHFELLGGNGPSILFVHGFPLSGQMWLPACEALLANWKAGPAPLCIVPDLAGHGHSAERDSYSIRSFTDDLVDVLNRTCGEMPVIFVGLSLGGMIGFEFFRTYRSRLRALVLACTRATPETPEGVARREAVARGAIREGSRFVADAMLPSLFGVPVSEATRERWRAIMSVTAPRAVAGTALALAARPDSRPTLPQIDVPTLVIAGELDTITPVAELREIADGVRGARLEVFPGARHMVPLEQPAAFAALLAKLVESLPAI